MILRLVYALQWLLTNCHISYLTNCAHGYYFNKPSIFRVEPCMDRR